jgi:hypothetical protein
VEAAVLPPPLTANVGWADGAVLAAVLGAVLAPVLAAGAVLPAGAVVAGVSPPQAARTAPAAMAALKPRK